VRHQSKDVNRFQVCLLDDTLPCGVVRWNWFSGVMEVQSTLTRALSPPVPDVFPNASNICSWSLTFKKVC
jgi:hypothetical protein